ncbi:uncharacterized protein I206_105631 [Kwoniella pini CBS 10737]|uniref:Zn(2)-C6 fungal-type domain-containing protein n=1 Tax=Kwoniella pini CBS 10737 TaxID=1296096 RepID=A0AAJ8L962_9TREE
MLNSYIRTGSNEVSNTRVNEETQEEKIKNEYHDQLASNANLHNNQKEVEFAAQPFIGDELISHDQSPLKRLTNDTKSTFTSLRSPNMVNAQSNSDHKEKEEINDEVLQNDDHTVCSSDKQLTLQAQHQNQLQALDLISPTSPAFSYQSKPDLCRSPVFGKNYNQEQKVQSPNMSKEDVRSNVNKLHPSQNNETTPDDHQNRSSRCFDSSHCHSPMEVEKAKVCKRAQQSILPHIDEIICHGEEEKEKRKEEGNSKEPSNSALNQSTSSTSNCFSSSVKSTFQSQNLFINGNERISRYQSINNNNNNMMNHNPNPDYPIDQHQYQYHQHAEYMGLPPPPRSANFTPPLYNRQPLLLPGDRKTSIDPYESDPILAGPSTNSHHVPMSYSPPHQSYPHQLTYANPPFGNSYYQPGSHSYHPSSNDNKRRRGRMATACIECNRRKQKCDGSNPCGLCVKRRVECKYPTTITDTSYNDYAQPTKARQQPNAHSTSPTRQPSKKSRKNLVDDESVADSGNVETNTSYKGKKRAKEARPIVKTREDEQVEPMWDMRNERQEDSRIIDSFQRHIQHHLKPIASHPVSSERSTPILPQIDSTQSRASSESSLGRFWRSYMDHKPTPMPRPPPTVSTSAGNMFGNLNVGSDASDRDEVTSTSSERLMEENEARGVGSMRTHRGPWDDGKGEKTFFGTSHFGPQLAAKVIRSMPTVPLSDVRHAPYRGASRLDSVKPYTLESQTRELISHLPAQEECDRYVRRFFDRYNSHNDILYQPDFMISYHKFWNDYNVKRSSEVDLRYLALLLIVLALGVLLDHDPSQKSSRQNEIDRLELTERQSTTIRDMLEGLENQTLSLKDREEKSLKWSWAAKRALTESSNFFGESMETVRAGLPIALYLNVCRRVPEAWAAIGTAIRSAQAQGMHVDGSSWKGMSTKEAELRRRLWAQLYAVDRSISLFLGRPVCIQDNEFTTLEPSNMHDEELEEPSEIFPRSLNIPTKTTFLILHCRLAKIIGTVQLTCFNLTARKYSDIQMCEELFSNFKNDLPPHFKLDREGTDFSLDNQKAYNWLPIQRQTLNAKFHLARISLHRPYLLRSLSVAKTSNPRVDNPYVSSRNALLQSAMADLQLRFLFNELDPLDRFKWMTVASGFNSATILGILCHMGYKDSRFPKGSLRKVLQNYIALEEKTLRRDEALETELVVLKMMESKALQREREETDITMRSANASGRTTPASTGTRRPCLATAEHIEDIQQSTILDYTVQTQLEDIHRHTYFAARSHLQAGEPEASIQVHPSSGDWPYPQSQATVETGIRHPTTDPFSSLPQHHQSTEYPVEERIVPDAAMVPLPAPTIFSRSTPSLSNIADFTNYHNDVTYNQGQQRNFVDSEQVQNTQNDWYIPSDQDPTTSGLPDSSDPLGWQALLGMDWMNDLDFDYELDFKVDKSVQGHQIVDTIPNHSRETRGSER